MVNVVRCGKIPRSVAFIMDGNRRYAVRNKREKHQGHSAGLKRLETALIWCKGLGVAEVTVFALAKDNLKRSKVEVDTLMGLCKDQFARLARNNGLFQQQQIKIRILGDLSLLPKDVEESLRQTEALTSHHTQTTLNVCICYSSKDEITEALAAKPTSVGEFEAHLYGGYNIKPDIVVRTSGEVRLSNFMLYQTQESHHAFIDTLWPDFSLWDFLKIIMDY